MNATRRNFRATLSLVALVAAGAWASGAQAEVFDDIDVRREGKDAVVQVRFTAPVQFLRAVNAKSGDLAQVFYELVPGQELPKFVTGERREFGGDGLPKLSVSDEAVRGDRSRKFVLRFALPAKFKVRAGRNNRTIDIVIEGAGAAAEGQRSQLPVDTLGLTINLARSADTSVQLERPIPAGLQDLPVYSTRRVEHGQTVHEINLGKFATRAQAEQALVDVQRSFPQARIIEFAADASASQPLPAEISGAAGDLESQARHLLAQARAHVQAHDDEAAVAAFNQLLNLPPNSVSQEAQAQIGLARARLGDVSRARAEFELYLKLYPNAENAGAIREALAALPASSKTGGLRARPSGTTTQLVGSLSQYYYGGRSQISTLLKDTPLEGTPQIISAETLSDVDQSQLVSNLDLSWRRRTEDSDLRLVLRDSYTKSFLSKGKSKNKLTAAYADYRQFGQGLSARIGRQSPTGGGVLSRFDGAVVGYSFVPKWRVNAVAGVPSESLFETQRRFYGVSVDAEGLGDKVSGSLYLMQQTVDGEIDRRAVGADVRYFDSGRSMYSLVDYDTLYKAVNIASVQGSWQTEGNTTFSLLLDRRTAPMLATANALLPMANRSLTDLLATRSLDAVRQLAKATTAYANQALLGVTWSVSPTWQIGTDARLTNIGALPAYETIAAQPGTGNIWSYSVQAIGTNLYSLRDVHVIGATYIDAPAYTGKLISYNNLSVVWENLQLEPSIKYYTQSDRSGLRLKRWTPGLRASYKLAEKVSLESEISVERSRSTGPTLDDTATRVFFYLGYRYEF